MNRRTVLSSYVIVVIGKTQGVVSFEGVAGASSEPNGNNESRSGLERRERRISMAKQTMKTTARLVEMKMVRDRTFTDG
jgi:hypothetical protein